MHNTHTVYCLECGKNLALWSGFGDNMQYQDEYQCHGNVWWYHEYWRYGNTHSNQEPTPEEVLEQYGKPLKITRYTKELFPCFLQNNTYFCKKCAKKLDYKCSKCKKEIKLSRKN